MQILACAGPKNEFLVLLWPATHRLTRTAHSLHLCPRFSFVSSVFTIRRSSCFLPGVYYWPMCLVSLLLARIGVVVAA